jgi:hypothetical protein
LRRSDSIRNSYSAGSKIPNCGSAKPRIRALKAQPPGTEFLDAETGRQKSPPNYANARRDPNPGNQWPKIPAETPYLAPHRKRVVCKDWMVETSLASHAGRRSGSWWHRAGPQRLPLAAEISFSTSASVRCSRGRSSALGRLDGMDRSTVRFTVGGDTSRRTGFTH